MSYCHILKINIFVKNQKILLKKVLLIFAFASFTNINSINAQHFTHDVGIFAGLSVMKTDYGERSDFKSNFGNIGASLSIAHYLHFFNKSLRWNPNDELLNRIAIKSEFNFVSTTLNHHGKEANDSDIGGAKLKAMIGTNSIINLGLSLEYYFINLSDFIYPYSNDKFNPYFTFGIRYSFYNNTINSSYGAGYNSDADGDNPAAGVLPSKYYATDALKTGSGGALGFSLGFGSRYKLTEKIDLAGQFNWQVFLSDTVDALQVKELSNKNNEWLLNFQLGVIYHLNLTEPLF